MALATLTSRVEENDKALFISFCDSVGLTSSAAINMFVKAVNREHRIPFEIKVDLPNKETIEAMLKEVVRLIAKALPLSVSAARPDLLLKRLYSQLMELPWHASFVRISYLYYGTIIFYYNRNIKLGKNSFISP